MKRLFVFLAVFQVGCATQSPFIPSDPASPPPDTAATALPLPGNFAQTPSIPSLATIQTDDELARLTEAQANSASEALLITETLSAEEKALELERLEENTAFNEISDSEKLAAEAPFETSAPDLIWERLRAGYALPEELEHQLVQHHIRWHQCHLDYLQRVTARAEPVFHYILEEIDKRGLPTELALLPIVESAYIPYAYSRSHAAGLWQFIPSTGEYFGLRQDWWYDGRRDIVAATDAALRYLERLHRHFDGDWLLAIAAYNAGEGAIGKAIKRNRAQGKGTRFWDLKLSEETTNYVPKLLALKEIFSFPELYDIDLWPIENRQVVTVVNIKNQIDIAKAASFAGLNEEYFRNLNPGFNQWATAPQGPHRFILPLAHADRFLSQLETQPKRKLLTWKRHKIQRGETLSHIARQHNTTINVLKSANDLSRNQIRAGSYLLVPAGGNPQLSYAQRPKTRTIKHKVKRGDTLWDIAKRYKVSIQAIRRWNNLKKTSYLKIGQKLKIKLEPSFKTAKSSVRKVRYSVKRGDSLYTIAKRYRLGIADIKRWNRLSSSLIKPGQILTLHVKDS